ncbi:hypothetical protein [Glaesserella parasuis]|uniref:hypothetical protein n=1 Tax=Glaesserella parasuis TaxID=738 RepID=UPI00276E9597|nr:hypothetical protein [Glaesserella parasuis]
MKIEFPATTGENPIVEGDKVTINYTPENTDGTAGTPTTLTYTYTGGNWVQDEKDSLKLEPTTDQSGKVSVTIPEDKVADKTSVSATTTDVAGRTSAESETSKKDAPFDVKSDKPAITSIKAIDTSTTADKDPERVIIEGTSTEADGTKVYLYKEGQTNGQPIAETTVTSGKFKFDISEPTATPLAVGDRFVATVQTFAGNKATEEVSQPSDAFTVPEVKLGKHDDNNVANSGGHTGDTTEPTTAPTLEALTDDANLGSVKVGLPTDAVEGDRVIVTFTPEDQSKGEKVTVTLTKKNGQWESGTPDLIANPVNGNEVTIEKGKVKDNTEVTAVIKDLADNEKASEPSSVKAYPNNRTLLENGVAVAKAIDTDDVSNATPEKFTITGKSEKGAVVKAYVTHNGEKVEIGSFEVTSEDGSFSFDTTDIKKDDALKAKLPGFTFNTNGSATPITVEATKEGKAPSHAQTVNAKAAEKGVTEQHEEKTAPANPTITPYMEGFGGAKVELPTPAEGETLEVEITVTPKVAGTNNNATPTNGDAKKVTLAYNGSEWTVQNSNGSDNSLVTLKDIGGKKVAIISGDKAPLGGTISATTTDFAGNKPEAVTQNLNKGPTDETAKEPDYSKARTDVPTIKAGRTEGTGTNGDQPNAGDIVAKPGGDNDRMVVKYKDNEGKDKEIVVKKDLEQGKWVLDTTQPAEQDKKPAEGDYIIKDDGTVIVKGPQVQDGSEAEAVGYKGGKASTDPYVDGKNSDGTWKQKSELIKDSVTNQPLTRETKAIITTHKDDNSPTQTDKPTVSKGDENTLEKGSAKIKPGQDNTEVVVNFKGYARTVTETPNSATGTGQAQPTTRKAITTKAVQAGNDSDPIYTGAQNTFATEEVDAVLVARKENGEWKLYSATKEDYEHKEQGDDGQQHPSPRNLSPVSDDVATIDKDGNIVLKAAAVKDNTQVSATGFNAMKSPAQGAKDDNNITVDGDLTAEEVKNKTVDVPTIQQLNDGSVVAKPGQDNKEMTVTYTAPNGEQKTIKVKETTISDSNAPEGSTKWVVEGQNPDNLEVNPTTGAITIPKDKVKVDEKVNATGKDEQNNEAKAEELTVKADATPESAEAAKVTTEGDKVVSEPGGDSKTQTVNEVDPNTGEKTPIVVAEKGEDGKWKLDESDPNKDNANGATVQDNGNKITITKDGNTITLDKDTGKITIDPGVVSDGKSISTETTDASGNTTSSEEPIVPPKKETSTDRAEKPIITPLDNGENKGGVQIKPGSDNTTFTVSYVKEPETTDGNTNTTDAATRTQDSTLTAVKDKQTGKWSFSETVASDVAEINAEDGTITLKAKAVMDGSKVKAEGQDILGNKQAADEGTAPNNPDVVAPEAQPKPPQIVETPPAPPAPPATETPTLFENVKPGEVKITAGQGVDYINFKVQVDTREAGSAGTAEENSYLNYVLVKNEAGTGWDQFVYRITDTNKNDSIDEGTDSFVDVTNDPNTMKLDMVDSSSGVFVLKEKQFMSGSAEMRTRLGAMLGDKINKNAKTDKIFDIIIGREGSETIDLPNTNGRKDKTVLSTKGAIEDFTLISAGNFDTSTNTSSNFTKAPKYHHVLSNGEDITSPVFKVTKVGNSTEIEVLVDKDLNAVGFDLSSFRGRYEWKRHYLTNNGTWEDSTSSYEGDGLITRKTELDSETKVGFIIKAADGINLSVDDQYLPETGGDAEHRLLKNIVYGAKKDSNTGEMPKYYPVDGDPDINESGSNGIKLANIDLKYPDVVVAQPTPAPKPVEPAPKPAEPAPKVEELDQPVAKQDSSNGKTGGVIVAPKETSSTTNAELKTKNFRVDYQQPDGANKAIWFKYDESQRKWTLDSTKANGLSQLPSTITLNESNGQVTFAPSAVKDKTNVTITALDSNGVARKNATAQAAQEPQPVRPTAEIDSVNRGGAIVTPKENTNKFKLTYYDENNQKKELTYEKGTDGQWALKSGTQAPSGVALSNDETGTVTLSPNAVKDGSQVKIESYNNEDRITQSADVTTTTDKVEYTNVVGNGNGTPTGRVGYAEGTGIFGIKWHDQIDVYQDWSNNSSWGLQQVQEGKYGNSKPTSVSKDGQGATYTWGNNNDTVYVHESLGIINDQSGKNYKLNFNFQQGNDTLIVGNDLGTRYKSQRQQGTDVISVNMGDGDDLLMVGTDNEYFDEFRNKKTGEIEVFAIGADGASNWASSGGGDWEKLNNQINHGGQNSGGRIENATINMGNGDDTIIVEGITYQNWSPVINSTIYLGDGNNRFIVAPNGAYAYKPGHYFNSPMQARGSVEASKIIGGKDSDYVRGALFEKGANIQLNAGNDIFIANRFQSSTLDMGSGDDIVEIKNYSKDEQGQTFAGNGTIAWDTEIGEGSRINLGSGNDTFRQDSKGIGAGSLIDGGTGIDLYRIAGGARATTDKVKGFERIELMDNGAVIGIRYGDLKNSGLEGPVKIYKGLNVDNNDKVKVDLGNNNNDWLTGTNTNSSQWGDASASGTSWNKSKDAVTENGRTYDVYTINGDQKVQVWIENGILVI